MQVLSWIHLNRQIQQSLKKINYTYTSLTSFNLCVILMFHAFFVLLLNYTLKFVTGETVLKIFLNMFKFANSKDRKLILLKTNLQDMSFFSTQTSTLSKSKEEYTPMSDVRRRVRRVICKNRGNPRYFKTD